MSRIGKKPIEIPQGVEVSIKDSIVKVKGGKGEIEQVIPSGVFVEIKDGQVVVSIKEQSKKNSALWGLIRALLQNAVMGVSQGFEKQLEIIGVGYRANMKGDKLLDLAMGFSHPVEMPVPEGLQLKVEKNIITISGINKEKVGQFAAEIRAVRKPEPYKGKGIRYLGEKVRRKEGKKAATATN